MFGNLRLFGQLFGQVWGGDGQDQDSQDLTYQKSGPYLTGPVFHCFGVPAPQAHNNGNIWPGPGKNVRDYKNKLRFLSFCSDG